jgi:hypothetical protein
LAQPRQPDGNGAVAISGELKQWHKVTLTLDGPFAAELDHDPNPYTDYNLIVTFTHESGSPSYKVPAYFAADGIAGGRWFNPRQGGTLQTGSVKSINGGGSRSVGLAPQDAEADWLAVLRR